MSAAELLQRRRNPFERLFDALVDPARCERVMPFVLAGHAAAWSLYGVVAKSSQDLHFDMGEMYAWSRQVSLGTPKHPPFGAWLVRGWFSVLPLDTWSYYLLAVLVATAALWIAWRVAAPYLPPEKRAIGVVLLTLVPFYNFHALKFNANTVLIPLWAAATWWFLRSFETRRPGWAVLAGVGAAAAMLGKYWSLFLLAGLAIAALSDPRRGAYLRSPAPWLSIAVASLLLAPHAAWVATHGLEPIHYAIESHPATLARAAFSVAMFFGGILAYLVAPIGLTWAASHPGRPAIRDALLPAEPARRIIVIAFAAPLLLAAMVAIPLRVQIGALWTMSAMTLLPVVLLSSPLVRFSRMAGVRLLALAIAFPLVMVAVSPVIAMVIHREGVPNYATHYRLIAQAVERAWHQRTDAPLRIVGSETSIVNGLVFYLASAPSTLDIVSPAQTPWVTDDRIKSEGLAIVCPKPEDLCRHALDLYAVRYPVAAIDDVALARSYFGVFDRPMHYQIVIILPQ